MWSRYFGSSRAAGSGNETGREALDGRPSRTPLPRMQKRLESREALEVRDYPSGPNASRSTSPLAPPAPPGPEAGELVANTLAGAAGDREAPLRLEDTEEQRSG